jgi:hypothetical protein
MSSPPTKKVKMEETSSLLFSTPNKDKDKVTVPPSVTVLKNDNVPEETWMKFDNTYRLTKTGCGMTLLERVERLESQMESQDFRLNMRKKEIEKQRQMLMDCLKETREDAKDAKFFADYMHTTMNTKLDDKIDHLQEYTEMAIDKLNKRTKILNDTVDKCVESCTETLEVIKGEERGRSLALDQLIQDSKEKSC